jgi:hypothetical protein
MQVLEERYKKCNAFECNVVGGRATLAHLVGSAENVVREIG